MARLGSNPIKSPLDGNELLAGEDPSTNDDICVTPSELSTYVGATLPVVPTGFPGLVDVLLGTKILALDSQTITDAKQEKLANQAVGFFVGTPANGFVRFYSNPTLVTYLIRGIRFQTSAGTLTLQISKNGVPVPGFEALAVSSTADGTVASGTNLIAPNDFLEFTISANSSGANLFFTMGVIAQLT